MSNYNIDYAVDLPSSPIEYTPATELQANLYKLIAGGNAFNTKSSSNAALVATAITDLQTILHALGGATLNNSTLTGAGAVITKLAAHVEWQFENIIDNLTLVSSGISDAIGYGVIGTAGAPAGSITDPTASYQDFFGSITGKSDQYVAQLANQIAVMTIYAAGLLAAAMISTLSESSNSSIQAALGDLAQSDVLEQVATRLSVTDLAQLETVMMALGAYFSSADCLDAAQEDSVIKSMLVLGIVTANPPQTTTTGN